MAITKEYKMGMDLTAKTFAGLEEVLADELRDIGALEVKAINRGVQFRGDTEVLYKANYLARTALRILKPVGVFRVTDQDELYKKVRNIDWTGVFNIDQTFIVNANVFHSELNHSHFVALKTKDAIVDQFRDKTGKRPWVGKEDAQIFIDVHISHDVCTVSLDSSGESLHRRGYRIAADKAPINEVLAAGMIRLTGWKGEKDFYDPMCGSATIPMEAAMAGMNIPAGYYRKHYAFMNWADFDPELWNRIREAADLNLKDLECRILASDRSEKAVKLARRNLKHAGLHKDIDISTGYFDNIKPKKKEGILVFNPPYGKRLEERGEIFDLYRKIGDVLKQHFAGFEAWIISSNFEAAKFVGLKPSAKIPLYNGPIETRFIKFELYEGSKKGMFEEEEGERKDYRKRKDDHRRKDHRQRDTGDKRDFRKRHSGDDTKDEKKGEGRDKRKFRQRDDEKGRSFKKRDGEFKKDFRKKDDGRKKDFKKRDGDKKTGFHQKDDVKRRPVRKSKDDNIRVLRQIKDTGDENPESSE